MLICGIKASHDGAVALVENGRLLFSVELEKLDNGTRHAALGSLDRVGEVLRSEGVDPADVDQFVVDGWIDPQHGPAVPTTSGGKPLLLPVAPYLDTTAGKHPLHRHTFDSHSFTSRAAGYSSYFHASNHLFGAYCSSPFAARGEDALVLVWDGGMPAQLYEVSDAGREVRFVSSVLSIQGNLFGDFCSHFEPFYRDVSGVDVETLIRHHLSVAGKAMAYAALGTVETAAFEAFDRLIGDFGEISLFNAFTLGQQVVAERDVLLPGLSNADIIATFQEYLGHLLVTGVETVVRQHFPNRKINLCLGGGCALNIKWSSKLRGSGLFSEIWIPPFPNDSGAAIGTACCEMLSATGRAALDWDVYSGPCVYEGEVPAGWLVRDCDERGLAQLLHSENEPVVVLSGRAEIGPRALGARSILAPATSPDMKDRLNAIKGRDDYRPVAPICLASRAAEVFDPGGVDPYMVFEHRLRDEWEHRIPAVVHLDGTARLQTIDSSSGSATGIILAEYEKLSGVPVLCNTSANLNGHGFFPSVAAAADWGRTRYIWSERKLYTNPDFSG